MQPQTHLDYLAWAKSWFGHRSGDLDAATREIVQAAADRRLITTDPNKRLAGQVTVGERLADRVASFGGSWTFIIIFVVGLVSWVVLNSAVFSGAALDPFPYIFLNLMLSMVAALQAPIIMMSQNRQASKDRQMAAYDYEINLKAEMEIMALHEKMDAMRTGQIMLLVAQQQEQIGLLTTLLGSRTDLNGARSDDAPGERD